MALVIISENRLAYKITCLYENTLPPIDEGWMSNNPIIDPK